MLSVTKRLQAMGGSACIILPKVWLESKGLGPHDTVEVVLNDNLTIKPMKKES